MTKKVKRINQLISVVKERNGISVRELANIFHVSEMTIRRDLQVLESNNIVSNVYGATIYNPANQLKSLNHLSDDGSGFDSSYVLKDAKGSQNLEKDRIGKYAAGIIAENDIVIIDTGSTTERLAEHISRSLSATIMCFNLNIVSRLSEHENVSLILGGGYFHPNTQMFESAQGISLVETIRATKAFVSAAGVHKELGITCANNYESPTKRAILQASAERILLIDSSKFGSIRSSFFANITDFHKIITDTKISSEWIDYIKSVGIELITV